MNKKIFYIRLLYSIFSLILLNNSIASTLSNKQVIDLTYPFNNSTIYWPTEKGFNLKSIFYGKTPGGFFYSAYQFCAPEHGGTHLDAPRHFSKNGFTVDKIPVSQFIGSAVVINVVEQANKNTDYEITKADIKNFEKKYRKLNKNDIVLFYTGWGKYWNNKKQYLGSDKLGDVKHLHFPGLSKQAAEYLVQSQIKGIGIDTASMDPGKSQDFWVHRIILGANLFGIENVAHLDLLPAVGGEIIVAPMKISNGSGGPTRVLGILRD